LNGRTILEILLGNEHRVHDMYAIGQSGEYLCMQLSHGVREQDGTEQDDKLLSGIEQV